MRAMEDRAGGGGGLQPTVGAHPQACASPPVATAAAVWARESVRPAQSSQILPTRQLVGKPGPKFLIGPRIVTPTDRTPTVSHVHTLLHSSRYAGHAYDSGGRGPRHERRSNPRRWILIDLPMIWMQQKRSRSPVRTHMPFLPP